MAHKITWRMFFLGLGTMLLAVVCAMGLFYRVYTVQVQKDVKNTGQIFAAGYEANGGQKSIDWYTGQVFRLTLITPEGDVLYDSATEGTLENHRDRPEVVQALKVGEGEDQRLSATLSVNTFYYAVRLSDGNVLRVSEDAKSLYAVFDGMVGWLLLFLCVLVIFSILTARHLTRTLVQPIIELGKHLDEAEKYLPYPELEPLTKALSADRDLRQNSEKIRRDFTANVSHELKTPLTSISGYAELISTGLARPEDVGTFVGNIQCEVKRMTALVNDIIQLTELDSMDSKAETMPEMGPLDLLEVAKKVTQNRQINAYQSHVTLLCQGNSQIVQGNEGLLEELCENLVENAIRYNRPGGKVWVVVGAEDGASFLRVRDNGIGIPKESQSRVFERFYRVDKSRSKEKGGTGLGLAIVKHVALLHGAKINLISQVGDGTEITVVFSHPKP